MEWFEGWRLCLEVRSSWLSEEGGPTETGSCSFLLVVLALSTPARWLWRHVSHARGRASRVSTRNSCFVQCEGPSKACSRSATAFTGRAGWLWAATALPALAVERRASWLQVMGLREGVGTDRRARLALGWFLLRSPSSGMSTVICVCAGQRVMVD